MPWPVQGQALHLPRTQWRLPRVRYERGRAMKDRLLNALADLQKDTPELTPALLKKIQGVVHEVMPEPMPFGEKACIAGGLVAGVSVLLGVAALASKIDGPQKDSQGKRGR